MFYHKTTIKTIEIHAYQGTILHSLFFRDCPKNENISNLLFLHILYSDANINKISKKYTKNWRRR